MSQQAEFNLDQAALSLDEVTAKIKTLHRGSVANTLEIGKWLLVAQKKCEELGVTFKEHCAKHFPYYK